MNENIHHGALPLLLEGQTVNDTDVGQLDTSSVQYLVNFSTWKADLAAVGVTKGAAYAAEVGLWVKDMSRKREGDNALVDIALEGVLAGNGDKRQRRISAFGSVVSIGPIQDTQVIVEGQTDEAGDTVRRRVPKVNNLGEPVYVTISVPGGAAASRWNINDAGITVIDTYYTTAAPDMTEVSTAITPPSAPDVPAYLWGSYGGDLRSNFPAGWVLSNREPEQLYGAVLGGAGLWRVTDTTDYYFAAVPD